MDDVYFPSTPSEIAKSKAALFRHQQEFIHAKDEVTSTERSWLAWAVDRVAELEVQPV